LDLKVFSLVIFSAIFQASWNFFAKKSKADKTSLLVVGWFILGCALLVSLPLTVDFSEYNSEWLYYGITSGIIHAAYVALLGWGYTVGDISIVFPISRGLAILWTTLATISFGIHSLSLNGAAGITAIMGGVFLIGHKAIKSEKQKKGFLVAILVSITIALYSINDSKGIKVLPLPFYLMMMNLGTALFAIPFLLKFSKQKLIVAVRKHKFEGFLIGVGGSVAYAIILWAFRNSPVSYVAALREISVAFAALLGIALLNEELSKRKIFGVILVTAGAILIKWS
jgi:drug/metabolite transporter (DMT)-like permease